MFLMLPAPPGLDSQNPTIAYVYGGLKMAVTPAFSSREGKGGGVDAITTLGAWNGCSPLGQRFAVRRRFWF
jgi:hypothetical protein